MTARHHATLARHGLVAAATLFAAVQVGCGSGCPFGLRDRIHLAGTLGCCGSSFWQDVSIGEGVTEVDLAFLKAGGAPPSAHAWLTTPSCSQLFEGPYPPASGVPSPRCTVFIGPVTPGEVSARHKVEPGTYRVWVQAWTNAETALDLKGKLDVGFWGDVCNGRPGL